MPYQLFLQKNERLSEWGNTGPSSIIKLRIGIDSEAFSAGIEKYIQEHNEGSNTRL